LEGHPEESFAHVIRERVSISLKTDLYDGRRFRSVDWDEPRWAALETRARELWERTRADADSTRFEEQGLAIFWPSVEAQARLDNERGLDVPPKSQCGSLRFDPPEPFSPHRRVFFHIGNAVRPHSILDYPEHMPRCLLCVMEKAGREFGCDQITTRTWLNSYRPWLAVFPPQWRENLGPEMPAPLAGMGYWGQFVNGRGTFNPKHAALFRQTGRLPFCPRGSWCSFDALREHLRKIAPGAFNP
jgi:hypothetical protein